MKTNERGWKTKIKVGDRVTRLGDHPLRWGTVIRIKKGSGEIKN